MKIDLKNHFCPSLWEQTRELCQKEISNLEINSLFVEWPKLGSYKAFQNDYKHFALLNLAKAKQFFAAAAANQKKEPLEIVFDCIRIDQTDT